MTFTGDSRRLTPRQIHNDKLIGSNGIFQLIFFSDAKFDEAPAPQEVFVNAVRDQRLYLPRDTAVIGSATFVAWNATTNSAATVIQRVIDFSAINDDDVVSFAPAPVTRLTNGPGTLELALNQDDASIRVNLTGAANATYLVRGRIDLVASGSNAREFSNYFTNLT